MGRQALKIISPLRSWDIFAVYLSDLHAKMSKLSDVDSLHSFKKKYSWTFDPESILPQDYTTIVVTNSAQEIQWVNPGFSEMTGYSKTFAIGKHPRFLQGVDTSQTTKAEIREALKLHKPVSAKLLNHRKEGSSYLCEIKIIPLRNSDHKVTHLIALEKKVRAA